MRSLLLSLACMLSLHVYASHIFGDELTYKCLGSGKYEITLTIYQDCQLGLPEAISQDNPLYINFFDDAGHALFVDIDGRPYFDSMWAATVTSIINSPEDACKPAACLQKMVVTKIYTLPVISTPGATYTAVVQRCCRTASVVNIDAPAATGATFYATIPANSTINNNAAIFKNDPVYFFRINKPLVYDASATDADADSLSYEFCTAYAGGSNNDAKPYPLPPPYTPVTYTMPFSYAHPITSSPDIQIDANTGIISGTPTAIGRYLVVVGCHEWRKGVTINTTRREIQFVITNCDTTIKQDTTKQETYIYVSPSTATANISFTKGASNISVVDILNGSVVYMHEITSNEQFLKISTASWSKGIYVVRLMYPKTGSTSTKFVLP